ncbi:MAG: hypothetical protein Q8S84_01900 [bacterium]|nr:hypothetical protein [bacterium]
MKYHLGFATIFIFETIDCQNNAINNNIVDSQSAYITKFNKPNKNQAGKIIANIKAYVGLQLVNTGHSENHISILFLYHFDCVDLENTSLVLFSIPSLYVIFFHKSGNNVIIQSQIINHHENIDQKLCGNVIKKVVAFNNIEKSIIEIANEAIIIYGHFLLLSSILHASIIGKSGKTHGASIVKTPAIKDIINSIIIL